MTDLSKDGAKTEYITVLGDGDGLADASIRVGGVTSKFVPNINASKWGDAAWLNINPKSVIVGSETEVFTDNKVSLTIGGVIHRYYVDANGHLEYEIEFPVKPVSNILEFDIDFSTHLYFVYQDTLENDWAAEWQDAYPVMADFLKVVNRPDNVIGSYVVNYNGPDVTGYAVKTRKFCHIFRPKLIDKDLKSSWAELHIDPVLKKLTITMDQAFLDTAKYPVILDPDMGYSAQGGSEWGVASGFWVACHDTTDGTGGDTVEIHCYARCPTTNNLAMAVYDDDAGNNRPEDQQLAEVNVSIDTTSVTEHKSAYVVSLSASTKYWVVMNPVDGVTIYVAYDSDVANRQRYHSGVANDLPANWGTVGSNSSGRYSIWADYGAAAGGLSMATYQQHRRRG